MMKYLLVYVLLIFCICRTEGQENVKFFHITSEHGLSKNSVISIFQDSDGFMWFGTMDGLNKYDGYQFTIYREDKLDPSSISSNIIYDIKEDKEGNLWFASPEGVSYFDRDSEKFMNFTKKKTDVNSYSFEPVKKIFIDNDNRIFVVGEGGLGLFDNTSRRFRKIIDIDINTIHLDDDKLWLGTNADGIYLLDAKSFEIEKQYLNNSDDSNSPSSNSIIAFKEDAKGTFWIGYESSGVDFFNSRTETFEHYGHDPNNPASLCNDNIRVIEEGIDNELWIGTYKGISRIVKNGEQVKFKNILYKENDNYGLSHNSIYDIYNDKNGTVWIATYFGGLSVFDQDSQLFDFYKPEPNNEKSLSYRVVGRFMEAHDDKVWVATEGGGLNLFDPMSGTFDNFSYDPSNAESLPDDNIKAIWQTEEGNLWLGLLKKGLMYFNPRTAKKIKHYNTENSTLKTNVMHCLFQDRKGILWVGTDKALYRHNPINENFEEVRMITNDSGEAITYNIKSIIEDANYNVWVGTSGRGLFLWDRKKDHWVNYEFDEISQENSDHNFINYIYEDTKQNIWAGTLGGGLLKFDPSNKKFKAFLVNDGLVNNIVLGIVEDDQGFIWITTSNGLSRLDPNREVFKNFGINSRLPVHEFNEGSCFKSKDGTIFMGGFNGFVTFRPEHLVKTKYDATLVLTSLKIANKLIQPGNARSVLQKRINEHTEITLDYKDRNISIGYAYLNYLPSGENQYAYKLKGFDKDWNFVGSKKEAAYTNLSPGSYILDVTIYDDNGVLKTPFKSIAIKILPPLWKKWWAYLIYALVIVGLLYAFFATLRYRNNIRKNLEIEYLERKKIEELNQFKLRFYTNISHEFRTPLTLIISPLERLMSSKSGDSFLRNQHQLLYKNAVRLQHLIDELMDFRKVETGNLHLKVGKGNIVKFITEIKMFFDEYAKERGISYSINSDHNEISMFYDRDQLEKVFFNLLSNAFKFTKSGGSITLKIEKDEQEGLARITVSDTGKGMTKEESKYIFKRFYQIDPQQGVSKTQRGTGIGLALTSEIVKLHRGNLSVKSEVDIGTATIVELPTGRENFLPEEIIEGFQDSEQITLYNNRINTLYQDNSGEGDPLIPIEDLPEDLPRILIVEDNQEIKEYIISIFKKKYGLISAADGEEALHLAEKHLPDLIISDIMMPKMNGIELCGTLKRGLTTSHIPVILLTARTSLIYQVDGLETGADDYITKPFNSGLLVLKVDNLINNRRNLKKYFLGEVNIEPQKATVTPIDEKFMRRALDIVEANLSDASFDVNRFVDLMNVSRSKLFPKLKNLTGQTPNDFIRTLRLKRAAQILQQDKLNNSEVCYMVGFNTPRHFRKCFLEFFGKTPVEYAKEYQKLKENS